MEALLHLMGPIEISLACLTVEIAEPQILVWSRIVDGPHSMLARSNGRSLPAAAAGSWAAAELSFHEVLPVCKCFLYPGRNYAERRGRRRIPDRKLKMLRTNLQACHKTKLG